MKKASLGAMASLIVSAPVLLSGEVWKVDSEKEWADNQEKSENLEFSEGLVVPVADEAIYRSVLKSFPEGMKATSLVIEQSPAWKNWKSCAHLGPRNLADAPVFLRVSEDNYWIFGRYRKAKASPEEEFVPEVAELEGFDVPLETTPYPNQYNAPGGLQKPTGGYHAWQSRDMVNWVHHGPVSDRKGKWMTTAEHVDGKTFFYYDFPNDQDPHLIIDEDLTDGKVGQKMGMAFHDPSHGSDCGIIRDLDGKFHLILENWDPIDASARSWDSPLAIHAVSENGIDGFQLLDQPAVDYRTEPTGEVGQYNHPHWAKEDPENYPTNVAEYEIHQPEQDAYGDWAAIAIGGQYYLFGDFDPAGAEGREHMSVAWFTSSDINEPFTFCGNVGKGHPDPDIMFAEGQFYLVTQKEDFVSPGPWVDGVEVRVGVDTTQDGKINEWTEWTTVKESYEEIRGFSKQVAKTPAKLDLSGLPRGFGFRYEVRLSGGSEGSVKPVLDEVVLTFSENSAK